MSSYHVLYKTGTEEIFVAMGVGSGEGKILTSPSVCLRWVHMEKGLQEYVTITNSNCLSGAEGEKTRSFRYLL